MERVNFTCRSLLTLSIATTLTWTQSAQASALLKLLIALPQNQSALLMNATSLPQSSQESKQNNNIVKNTLLLSDLTVKNNHSPNKKQSKSVLILSLDAPNTVSFVKENSPSIDTRRAINLPHPDLCSSQLNVSDCAKIRIPKKLAYLQNALNAFLAPFIITAEDQETLSVLESPRLLSENSASLMSLNANRQFILDNHLHHQRRLSRAQQIEQASLPAKTGYITLFGGYSTQNQTIQYQNQDVTAINQGVMGGSYTFTPQFSMGGILSTDNGNQPIHQNYTRYESILLSFFGQYIESSGFWSYFDFYYGHTRFNPRTNFSTSGQSTLSHTENRQMKTQLHGLHLKWGYDLAMSPYISIGPFLGFTRNHYAVQQNAEDKQAKSQQIRNTTNILSLGWSISTQSLVVNPYLHLSYNRHLSRRRQNEVSFSPQRPIKSDNLHDHSWAEMSVGANAAFSARASGYAAVNYSAENKQTRKTFYNVGFRYTF